MKVARSLGVGVVVLYAGACAPFAPPPLWEQPPPSVREGPVVPAERLHREVLDNGLEILVLEDHRLPSIKLGVVMRRGAAIVSPDRAGLASFTAELMERGAGELDALALARVVETLGASLTVTAGWDAITVSLSGLSDDRARLFEILADVVLRPRFDPGEAKRVRSERLAALEKAKDEPRTLARWHFSRVLYGVHRYGLPLDGAPETVAHLDGRSARAFHRRLFVARNAMLFAVGDVEPGETLEAARRRFGSWDAGEVPEPGPPPPSPAPAERAVVVVDRPELVQAHVRIGHEGLARTDPDRVAATVMNHVLGGGGFLSRLMTRVRSEEGLAYGVGSGFSLRRYPGPFAVGTSTRVRETRRVVELLLAELERIRSEPPGSEELATARSFAAGRFALGLETSPAIVASLVNLDVYGLPRDSLDTYRSRVRAVAPEEVARVARERVHPSRVAVVVVGPASELRAQLEFLGPVEVVEP